MNKHKETKSQQHVTDPNDRVPFRQKLAYGAGSLGDSLMQNGINQMANPIFNIALHLNPMLISTAVAISRLWDAFTDPITGSISDNTRTRWGRRRPFIAAGAVLGGLCFAGFWFFPRGLSSNAYFLYLLIASLVFYTAYTIFAVPFTALGFEVSSDYHERTRIMAYRTFFGALGGILLSWMYWLTQRSVFTDTIQGMRWVGVGFGVIIMVLAIVPAIFMRERKSVKLHEQKKIPLLRSFVETSGNRPFRILLLALIGIVIGAFTVGSMGLYVNIYYVHGGDTQAASTVHGWSSTTYQIASLLSIPIITWVSTKVGKRRTLIGCLFIGLLSTILKWFCYTPSYPYLLIVPAALLAPAYSAIWTLLSSMVADVCDIDELRTGERREGMYGAIYWWVFKMALTLSLWVSGLVLVLTGFDVDLSAGQSARTLLNLRVFFTAIPASCFVAAIICVLRFPITEKKAYEVRRALEERNAKRELNRPD